MTLLKRSTSMQKVVVAKLLFRCPSCDHVVVLACGPEQILKCEKCGGDMFIATASSEVCDRQEDTEKS